MKIAMNYFTNAIAESKGGQIGKFMKMLTEEMIEESAMVPPELLEFYIKQSASILYWTATGEAIVNMPMPHDFKAQIPKELINETRKALPSGQQNNTDNLFNRIYLVATSLEDLVQNPGERHLMYGGTRTGKSTFEDVSIRHIQATRPSCMQLLIDTKPRFRAETAAYGPNNAWRRDAKKLYEHWAKGPVLPNSVAMNWTSPHPFRGLWNADKRPGEVVIVQHDSPIMWRYMNQLMHAFVSKKIKQRERLLIVDEGLDFYQRNTLGIDAKNDVILRTARAGGERNIGLLLGAHRPHGIPPLLNTLSSRVTLFHLRFSRDMHYLWEMGIPEDEWSPAGNYIAKQYNIIPGGQVSSPVSFILELPDHYLRQLAAS